MKGAQYESRQDYIDGSLVVNAERNAKEGLEEVKRFQRDSQLYTSLACGNAG